LLSPFPARAASALLDPSSKAAATKMEKVRFMTLLPSCVPRSTEVSWDGSVIVCLKSTAGVTATLVLGFPSHHRFPL
jgi:hypothetical protein